MKNQGFGKLNFYYTNFFPTKIGAKRKIFSALRAESKEKIAQEKLFVVFPRPLLVSGSPFLPPLSKRVSLLKICFSRPPAETKKNLTFFLFFSDFFRFQREISRKLEILRFSETATEVHKLFENQNFEAKCKKFSSRFAR